MTEGLLKRFDNWIGDFENSKKVIIGLAGVIIPPLIFSFFYLVPKAEEKFKNTLYQQTIQIADKNHDGIVDKEEWRDVYNNSVPKPPFFNPRDHEPARDLTFENMAQYLENIRRK